MTHPGKQALETAAEYLVTDFNITPWNIVYGRQEMEDILSYVAELEAVNDQSGGAIKDMQASRNDVLEEAAKVCDQESEDFQTLFDASYRNGATESQRDRWASCASRLRHSASAIRALKT